jgi:hypothetical protein
VRQHVLHLGQLFREAPLFVERDQRLELRVRRQLVLLVVARQPQVLPCPHLEDVIVQLLVQRHRLRHPLDQGGSDHVALFGQPETEGLKGLTCGGSELFHALRIIPGDGLHQIADLRERGFNFRRAWNYLGVAFFFVYNQL